LILIVKVLDRLSAEARRDAGTGNNAADSLPDLEVLRMHLGELIHVDARD
jgi:hypothetical protein